MFKLTLEKPSDVMKEELVALCSGDPWWQQEETEHPDVLMQTDQRSSIKVLTHTHTHTQTHTPYTHKHTHAHSETERCVPLTWPCPLPTVLSNKIKEYR